MQSANATANTAVNNSPAHGQQVGAASGRPPSRSNCYLGSDHLFQVGVGAEVKYGEGGYPKIDPTNLSPQWACV